MRDLILKDVEEWDEGYLLSSCASIYTKKNVKEEREREGDRERLRRYRDFKLLLLFLLSKYY